MLAVTALITGLLANSLRGNLRHLGTALKERESSEGRYRLLSNLSTDYVFSSTVHKDGSITHDWESGAFESISGYTAKEFRARGGWRATVHPDDLEIDEQLLEKLRRNETAVGELRLITKDGETRWIREYVHPIWDKNENRLISIYGAVQDVDEQKEAQGKLRQQAQQMSALYDIGLTITSKLDLNQILRDLFEKCRQLLPVDTFYIAVYDQSSGTIRHPIFYDGNRKEFVQVEDRNIETTPGLSGHVIRSMSTLYLPDHDDPAILEKYQIVTTGSKPSRSYVGAPMVFRGAVIGVISMQNYESIAYSPEQIRLLETIATQVAIAIDNARLFEEHVRRSRIIEALTEVANEIATTRDVLPVLDEITRRALDLLSANHVAIYLLNDDDTGLKVVSAKGIHKQELLTHSLKIGEGITGSVVASGKPEIIDLVANDRRRVHLSGTPEKDSEHETLMSSPLILRGKSIGAVNAWRLRSNGVFNQVELSFLTSIANQVSVAIESGHLFEETSRQAQEADTLRESLASVVGTLDFSEIIQRILDQIRLVVPYDSASIWRVEGNRQIFIGGRDLPSEIQTYNWEIAIGSGNSDLPIVTGKVPYILSNNVQEELTDFGEPPHNYINSWLAVPLKTKGKIIGVICLDGKRKNQFNSHHADLAVTFADQVAIALENASLYEGIQQELTERKRAEDEVRRQLVRAGILAELSQLLTSVTLNYQTVLDTIVRRCAELIGDGASIMMVEPDDPFLHLAAVYNSDSETDEFFQVEMNRNPIRVDEGAYDQVIKNAAPLLFPVVDTEELKANPKITPDRILFYERLPLYSLMFSPLRAEGKTLGVLGLARHHADHPSYTQADLVFLQDIADRAALAIINAKLYSTLEKELTERKKAEDTLHQRDAILQSVAHAAQVLLQSSNWRGSINQVLDELGQATVTDHAYIFENHVLDDGTEVTSQRYEWAAPSVMPDIDNPKYQNMPLYEEGVDDWVLILQSGRSYAGNILTLPEKSSLKIQERGIKSILDVPIFVGRKWWGEIGFDDLENVRDWTGSEIEIFEVAARMIGAAIEREKGDEAFRQNEERHRNELENQIVERTSQLRTANLLLQSEKSRIEQVVNEVAILRKLSDFLQSSMTIEEAGKVIASHMSSLFANTGGGLYLISDGFTDLTLTSNWGGFKIENVIQPNDCWGMRRGRAFVRHQSDASPACVHFGESIPDESLCLPLMGQNEIIGMLCLQIAKSENTYFTQDVQNLAVASADSIALALANLRLHERLHDQSIRDALTGLFNRRFMEETLAREVHRASRSQDPLCVVMFEIDDFKVYNNTYGHEAGNYVLRKVADTMRANLRRSDFPFRYGGDEFTLILPQTSLEDGGHRAEELRKAVEALALSFNNQALGQVTVRLGVAVYPGHGETGEAVLKVADDASYRARAIGKNCVVVAD